MDIPTCYCSICERVRRVVEERRIQSLAEGAEAFGFIDTSSSLSSASPSPSPSPSTSTAATTLFPVPTYAALNLAPILDPALNVSTNVPHPSTASRNLSAISEASTDTAYSHLSYRPDTSLIFHSDDLLILAEVLTLSPEYTDIEEVDLPTDEVPSLVQTGTEDDVNLDGFESETAHIAPDAGSLEAGWRSLDSADGYDDWECLHIQDGLLPPPPSPVHAARKAYTVPVMSLPSSTLAALALLALIAPSTEATALEATQLVEPNGMCPPDASVAWVSLKPIAAALLVAIGITLWILRSPCSNDRQPVGVMDFITRDDLALLSVTPPPEASEDVVPIERTRRTSGYTRRPIQRCNATSELSRFDGGLAPRAAAVTAASVALLASTGTASPLPSLARFGSQPLQWSAATIMAPLLLTAAVWAIRNPTRLDPTMCPHALRRPQASAPLPHSAAYISALAFVPAAMAAPTFNYAITPPETSHRKMHPGSIAAIALGAVMVPFALLTLLEFFGLRTQLFLRMGILRSRLYRLAVLSIAIPTGMCISILYVPYAVVMGMVMCTSAVTRYIGERAGLNMDGWWEGQAEPGSAYAVPPPVCGRDSWPDLSLVTDLSPHAQDEKDGRMFRSSPQTPATPLPLYPPPVYARSTAVVV